MSAPAPLVVGPAPSRRGSPAAVGSEIGPAGQSGICSARSPWRPVTPVPPLVELAGRSPNTVRGHQNAARRPTCRERCPKIFPDRRREDRRRVDQQGPRRAVRARRRAVDRCHLGPVICARVLARWRSSSRQFADARAIDMSFQRAASAVGDGCADQHSWIPVRGPGEHVHWLVERRSAAKPASSRSSATMTFTRTSPRRKAPLSAASHGRMRFELMIRSITQTLPRGS